VTKEMKQYYLDHVEHDQIQRSAFKAEKELARSCAGLLVCIFDFSTSQETPSLKARIGNWALIFMGNNGVPARENVDVISEHSTNYEFVGTSHYIFVPDAK